MIQIIPAVLATSQEQYVQGLAKLQKSESLKNGWVHIDFADGIFVPNKTIGLSQTAKCPTGLKKEAHLMVSHPKELIGQTVKAGFSRVLFHIECEDNPDECIEEAKTGGLETGLVLKHETPLEKLEQFIPKIDTVLLMGVIPGFQGQPFIEDSVDKIKRLRGKHWPVKIGIDGAVKDTNIKQIVDAGADYAIMGSYLMKAENIDGQMEKVREAVNG